MKNHPQTNIVNKIAELVSAMQKDGSINSLFNKEIDRFSNYSVKDCGLLLDYSKNPIDAPIMELLFELAKACGVSSALEDLFQGVAVNRSEQQAALHSICRMPAGSSMMLSGENWVAKAQLQLDAMEILVERVHNKEWLGYSGLPITDVVNVGIGGSDLGPALCVKALQPYAQTDLKIHFMSNVDTVYLHQQLSHLNPATTLFIIASKSFSTPETLHNASIIKDWLIDAAGSLAQVQPQLVAVTANVKKARAFGILDQHILAMWQQIGGRYSIWSVVGLGLAMSIGMPRFRQFLAGAYAMDQHVLTSEFSHNMPVILALIDVWLGNFMGINNRAIIPYSNYLRLLPDYLQQLCMESQGKSVAQDGTAVDWSTGLILWGGCGSNSQHSFHQLLMQGNQQTCIDFILPHRHYDGSINHAMLANCLAQSQVMMAGFESMDSHQIIKGNIPSNTLIMDTLDPASLGSLIALYEHKVFVQSVIWQINPFDQWGVQRGKVMAQHVLDDLRNEKISINHDQSTTGLIHYLKSNSDENK